ncbi:MAG: nucleotide exchange factor GrpE [Candidatus Paceibacterota bacterium]
MENNKDPKDELENFDKDRKNEGDGAAGGDDQLVEVQKTAEENLAGWQRAKADFLNYKKDQEKMLSDFRKYANADIITSLLPTVDSFDLAVKHLPEELKDSDWVKGIICIKGMFENFLRDAGVSEIKSTGEEFDPNLFEAVAEEESDEKENTVIEEVQKGYKIGERVIRPAKVKVAKRRSEAGA